MSIPDSRSRWRSPGTLALLLAGAGLILALSVWGVARGLEQRAVVQALAGPELPGGCLAHAEAPLPLPDAAAVRRDQAVLAAADCQDPAAIAAASPLVLGRLARREGGASTPEGRGLLVTAALSPSGRPVAVTARARAALALGTALRSTDPAQAEMWLVAAAQLDAAGAGDATGWTALVLAGDLALERGDPEVARQRWESALLLPDRYDSQRQTQVRLDRLPAATP